MRTPVKPKKSALKIEFEKAALAGTDINGWLGVLGAQMIIMLGIAIYNFYRILEITGSRDWIFYTRNDIKNPNELFGAPSLYDPLWSSAVHFELFANSVLIVLLAISAITYFSRSSSFRILMLTTMAFFSVACIIDIALVGSIKNYPSKLFVGASVVTILNVALSIPWCIYLLTSKWCALVYAKDRPSLSSLREEYGDDLDE